MSSPTSARQRWFVFTLLMLALLPVIIDMTILHIAVPSLTQALAASSTEVLWIIDIYPLLMAGLLVPMGTLVDKYGVRPMLLGGLTVFTLASAWAAFSPTASLLIASRVLLAVGGAMIMPSVLAGIRKTFEDDAERAMALGLWGAASAAGAAIGPLAGGVLLEHFWWGSVFLINVPVMAVVGPICLKYLPKDRGVGGGRWPIGQALIMIAAMVAIVYGVKAGLAGKAEPTFVGFVLLVGMLLMALFIRMQMKAKEPMLDLGLFRHRAIVAGLIIAVLVSGALAGIQLTIAQELQYVLDFTPLQAGAFMIPMMIFSGVGGPFAGWFTNKFGLRLVASVSLMVSAACLVWLAMIDFASTGLLAPAILGVLGFVLAIGLTASSIAIMSSVSAEQGGAAGALEGTGYELGAGLGITFFGVMLTGLFSRALALPIGLSAEVAQVAQMSIGDSFIVAASLPSLEAEALIIAAKAAFSATHATVLMVAGLLIGFVSIAVVFLLAGYRPQNDQVH